MKYIIFLAIKQHHLLCLGTHGHDSLIPSLVWHDEHWMDNSCTFALHDSLILVTHNNCQVWHKGMYVNTVKSKFYKSPRPYAIKFYIAKTILSLYSYIVNWKRNYYSTSIVLPSDTSPDGKEIFSSLIKSLSCVLDQKDIFPTLVGHHNRCSWCQRVCIYTQSHSASY